MAGYVKYLEEKGNAEEKSESYIDAIATYLKLVDVLLVYAEAVPTHPEWVKCTNMATNYQKKVKQLISLASLKQRQGEDLTSHGMSVPKPAPLTKPVPTAGS